MKTLEEIKQFYDSTLYAAMKPLESQRKSARNKIVLIGLGSVFGAILTGLIFPPLIIAWVFLFILLMNLTSRKYKAAFKQDVIGRLINFVDPGLNYAKDLCIPSAVFTESKVILEDFNIYNGDDYVSGRVGETQIEFSELNIEHETGSGKNRQKHRVFKGIFFIADFNKSFKTSTYVLPDVMERTLGFVGKFIQSKNPMRNQLISLENPEFEKYFAVYGDDQVEARYILSPSLMERLIALRKKSGANIYIAFKESKIYIAISHGAIFEPRLFSTILNFEPIRKYYEDLSFALGVVEDLNLNTRIWGKQP